MCTGHDLIARVARARLTYAENLVSGDLLGASEDVCARAVPACGVRRCGVRTRRESGQRHGCGWAVSGTVGGRRALVGSPLATALAPGIDVQAVAWGSGRHSVFQRCGVGHAWTLGLVRRLVALSGLLRRSPSGARRICCFGGGCSTERFLTMRTLRVARS
jgi:hypothetical protein